jgi:hypothetical protein
MNKKQGIQIFLVAVLILVAGFSRLLPHMHNFSPILGMSLFGAAFIKRKSLAFIIPISVIMLSDLFLQQVVYPDYQLFYEGWYFQYIAYTLVILAGFGIFEKVNFGRVVIGALAAALIFFIVTNFGAWISLPEYTKTPSGLLQAYIAGIPFFRGTLSSSVLFTGLLFTCYYLIQRFLIAKAITA